MKTIIATMFVFVLSIGLSYGQDIEKGVWRLGGTSNFGLSNTSSNGFNTFSISTTLDGGYFIANNLLIGTGFGFSYISNDFGSGSTALLLVGGRYYIQGKVFLGSSLGIRSTSDGGGTEADLVRFEGGYAFFVGKRFALEPTLRYDLDVSEFTDLNTFSLNLGLAYYFGYNAD